MKETWDPNAPGVLCLPSGRLVRGRGLARPLPDGPTPDFALYLLGKEPPAVDWESKWIRWPDFRLPSDKSVFAETLREAWARAGTERVEFACHGGHGRTGTALACLAVLDGVPAEEAVAFVREHYAEKAVETPWQRRFITRLAFANSTADRSIACCLSWRAVPRLLRSDRTFPAARARRRSFRAGSCAHPRCRHAHTRLASRSTRSSRNSSGLQASTPRSQLSGPRVEMCR